MNCSDFTGMIDAIKSVGLQVETLNMPPFDYSNIRDIDYDGPIIPYGGTNFIEKIRKTKKWMCWFNDNFQYKLALQFYGKYMFNSDANCMKMKDFNPSLYPTDECLFIRPNLDLKEFAGDTMYPLEFMEWYGKIKGQGCDIGEETDIVVAKASKIDDEWRIFVVDSKPISGSLYRRDHYLTKYENVPDKVYEFVEKMLKIWKPADVCVMDVCSLKKELFVLEMGDFHSAGFYLSDKTKIIRAVSELAEINYNK
jgi:hypothetical protein